MCFVYLFTVYIYIFCVYMHVCVLGPMFISVSADVLCVYLYTYLCVHVFKYTCFCLHESVCVCVFVCVFMLTNMCLVCMCMLLSLNVCVHVKMPRQRVVVEHDSLGQKDILSQNLISTV